MIYLDTHIVVWLYAGHIGRFGTEVQRLMNGHDLHISPIVQLELQYLYEIERITADPETIIRDLSARLGLHLCEKPFQAIVREATTVSWTRDPFDRLIVANASLTDNLLISKDRTILTHYSFAKW